jgi:hypothetical protein
VNCPDNVLTDGMVNRLVREAMLQSDIAWVSISAEQANSVRYSFTDESFKRLSICVLDNASNDVALAFDRANDGSLASVAATALAAFLIPMSVLVASADVGFINFDDPAELLNVLDHGGSYLMAHEPSSFVGAETHIAEDLEGAHALLADEHKVSDPVPVFERLIRVLKDCAGQVREAVALIRASVALPFELHSGDFIDAGRIAARATDALGPAPHNQISNAIFLGLKQFVELRRRQLVNCFGMFRASHFGILKERKDALA